MTLKNGTQINTDIADFHGLICVNPFESVRILVLSVFPNGTQKVLNSSGK